MNYSIDEIKRMVLEGKAFLIDVRSKEEVDERGSPLAIHLDLSDLAEGKRPETAEKSSLGKDSLIFLVCASGARAMMAEGILRGDGYTNVHAVGGVGNFCE